MSSATQVGFVKDAWQSPRNARTLRAFMALRNQEIGARIKELRARRGNPPQPIVAAAIGVAERTYQTWESGDAKPGYHNLQRLAEYFGVTESYVLAGIDERPVVEGVPEQLDGVVEHFSKRVDEVDARLAAIEDALEARAEHDQRVSDLLAEQTRLLDLIRAVVAGFEPGGEPSLPDRAAGGFRDAAARAGRSDSPGSSEAPAPRPSSPTRRAGRQGRS